MTKTELLALMRLLSALESWSFSMKERLPDYLHEDLCRSLEAIEREILKDQESRPQSQNLSTPKASSGGCTATSQNTQSQKDCPT